MRSRRRSWGWIGLGTVLALVGAAVAAGRTFGLGQARAARSLSLIETATVRRADLHGAVRAGGRVESASSTVIECELQSLEVRVRGQGFTSGGASTILDVVEQGTMVRKGDVLCRLDASDYEEMARQQRILVERARADFQTAELNLQVAEMAVGEYRDGNRVQDLEQLKGQISLSESECERLRDRVAWSRRMLDKGYAAAGQVTTDELALTRASVSLARNKLALDVYSRFTSSRALRTLESQVSMAQANLSYQTQRLERNVERLEGLERQIGYCTIRAPHDGLLVYANSDRSDIRIEPGATVRQRQRLFLLPDLSRMEVETLVHETVVEQVETGQPARVKIEGLPDAELEGHVISVAQLATRDWRSDVPYYIALVKLDTIPSGLRPGMTAEVEIQTGRQTDVLAIPPEALMVEQGLEYCYVARNDSLERREIKVGHATRELLEVTKGLEEGEEVVLDPEKVAASSDHPAAEAWDRPSSEPSPGREEPAEPVATH